MIMRAPSVVLTILVLAGPLPAESLEAPARLSDGLEVAAPAASALLLEPLAALNQAVVDETFPDTTSVLVAHDGRLVFERYFAQGGREVLNDTRSAMKSVTALAIGAALADGVLQSVEEPAFPWLADRAPFAHDGALKQAITLADLLTMSSALDCDDWDDGSPGNEENMYPQADWTRWAVDIPVKADYRRDAAGRGPFSYCTAGVFLLGQILQRAAGSAVDDYINRRLLDPLGISLREWPRSPAGEAMTGGGLRLRSRDLLKLGLLVSAAGRWGADLVVPADWIAGMLTVRRSIDGEQNYGYLWWQRDYRSPCGPVTGWYMTGNGGNVVVYAPGESLVAVVTRQRYNNSTMHRQTVQLLEDHVFAALSCARTAGEIAEEGKS